MFKQPSRQRQRRTKVVMNLVPIMDGVFIVVFFLLITASENRSFKIQTDLPVIAKKSEEEKIKKNDPPPLALALNINEQELVLTSGHRSSTQQNLFSIKRNDEGKFDVEKLHQLLVELKIKHPLEQMIIFQIAPGIAYEEIIMLMDSVRILRATDKEIYHKDQNGREEKVEELFTDVIFGNLLS